MHSYVETLPEYIYELNNITTSYLQKLFQNNYIDIKILLKLLGNIITLSTKIGKNKLIYNEIGSILSDLTDYELRTINQSNKPYLTMYIGQLHCLSKILLNKLKIKKFYY